MNQVRIAVLVSGGGTNLQALIDAQKAGRLQHGRLKLVISNAQDAYALTRAEMSGIPSCVVLRKEFDSAQAYEAKLQEILAAHNINMIILAGFMSILSADFTAKWPRRIINIHPALIPSFCGKGYYGLHVHEAVLKYGVKVTGATVHYVNEIPDGGEILLQRAVPVRRGDTPQILQRRVMEKAEWKILPKAAEMVAREIAGVKKRK